MWNKLKKYFSINYLQSIYYTKKLNLKRGSLSVFPKSNIVVGKTAKIDILGQVSINDSWFGDSKRRYFSDFRIDKNATFVCKGKFSLYQGASVYVAPNAKLEIRGNAFLNTNSTLNCFCNIEIGDNVAISDNVEIQDSDNHFIGGQKEKMSAPIKIEDNVWIGKNVLILKGVTIGSGSIIGAGSVVVKNIPPHSLAAGNPAKVIRQVKSWE
ncbi:MAG: acyltransferase [Prevotellaceae bacterium]|jgi:acetyltransferase-like isoleucine patch superfamily enzyme|nr:acyltransferase [Prevotellaceae bacterium]